jgi:hypothetical protein
VSNFSYYPNRRSAYKSASVPRLNQIAEQERRKREDVVEVNLSISENLAHGLKIHVDSQGKLNIDKTSDAD